VYSRDISIWAVGEHALRSQNSNGSFGSGTTGWTANNGATLATSSQPSVSPQFETCGVFHGNGSTSGASITYGSLTATPVTVGDWYQLSALIYSPQGWTAGMSLTLTWLTSAGGTISTTTTTAQTVVAGSLLYLTTGALRAPATAAYMTGGPAVSGTPASSVLFYVTNVIFSTDIHPNEGGPISLATPEVPYLIDVKLSSDRAQMFNQAILTQYGADTSTTFRSTDLVFQPTSGVLVTIQNNASVNNRAGVPYTATLYSNNTAQALPYYFDIPSMEDFGNWITQSLASPLMRPETVTITPGSVPQAVLMGLGAEVGDTVLFRRRPLGAPTVQVVTYISKLSHDIDIADGRWNTKYELSPFPQGNVLICDDPISGTLTAGNLLGW
jgi:hypothetical protein